MDKQKVFDTVKKHLLTQMVRAQNENNRCKYRTPDGLKCAIGALIKDEFYHEGMEGSVRTISLLEALNKSGLEVTYEPDVYFAGFGDGADVEFLGKLQKIHDMVNPIYWASELHFFAEDSGLNPGE